MVLCDLTQFYSPVSGGVKRYLREKVDYMRRHRPDDRHVLIIPGRANSVEDDGYSRTYTIKSPLLSRTARYRVLLRLDELRRIVLYEQPSLIESGDPYQVAWKAIEFGKVLDCPVVGFYHSHFPEAYTRTVTKFFGTFGNRAFMKFARHYVARLYNAFDRTLVASPALSETLQSWGVDNIVRADLGVNTEVFHPQLLSREDERRKHHLPTDRVLLLYVGRLAAEKNVNTLFRAYHHLHRQDPHRFHLLVIGDGNCRAQLKKLRQDTGAVSWISYCQNSADLATLYRISDILVHPGLQETFGLVAVESQACGTPVIGIKGSYMDRIIFNDQDHWAPENTPEALANAILEISQMDLQNLGREASEAALSKYNWKDNFDHIFRVYEKTIAEKFRLLPHYPTAQTQQENAEPTP